MSWWSEFSRSSGRHMGRVMHADSKMNVRTVTLNGSGLDGHGTAVAHRSPKQDKVRSVQEDIQKAFKEGYDSGWAAAMKSLEASKLEAKERIATAIEGAARELARSHAAMVEEARREVAEVAFELARLIIDRELTIAENPGVDAVARALDLVEEGERLTIRMNPDELLDPSDIPVPVAGCEVTVVADQSISRGSCIIEGEAFHIDASIDSALERVRTVLLEEDVEDVGVGGDVH